MAPIRRFTAASACAAAFCMAATPAAAVELPGASAVASHAAPAVYEGDYAEEHRWRRYRDRNRIDGGDILAGVLILGTIAAVARAANNNRGRDYDRGRTYPDDGNRYPTDYRSGASGIDRAAEMCVDEIERGPDRVGTVDGVNRTGDGWTVWGALEQGTGFTCRIDNTGRIRSLDIGGAGAGAAYEPAGDRQYDDDIYARARMSRTAAYPGAAPGDGLDDRPLWTGDDPGGAHDGRYDTSQTPDFEQGG